MLGILTGIIILLASGFLALLIRGRRLWASYVGAGGVVAAAVLGVVSSARILSSGGVESLRLAWALPLGELHVSVDALSAVFLLAVFGMSGLSAVYGIEYLAPYGGRKPLGVSWFFFNLLAASMVMVLVARDAVLFLIAWETMSLASFFLVAFENERAEVREAAWTYLVATHLGTAFLLVMFALLGRAAGCFDFDRFGELKLLSGNMGSVLFILALVGFGTKAGFMPVHVWLPEAHPAAPSHVSALMSGVMIKTGIYGLVRVLTWAERPVWWWGYLMVAIGLTSGVFGVLFALAQHDLKRLLAYHSVENIGIIGTGIGVGLIGMSFDLPALVVLGFSGAFLHVINHAIFKGLLFLAAGAVLHETGTRNIERLGGLIKSMPWTGLAFFVGAAAICGLPPLNGFVSELLIYLGAFSGAKSMAALVAAPMLAVVVGLALIGGLAAACFAKAFGIVFQGEPRSEQAAHAHECVGLMRVPMLFLAIGCALIGLFGPWVVSVLAPAVECASGLPLSSVAGQLAMSMRPLTLVAGCGVVLIMLGAGFALVRWRLLRHRSVSTAVTWDCGYVRPTARMQYTASSFAQPLTALFSPVLRTARKAVAIDDVFPGHSELETHTPDVAGEFLFRPIFSGVGALFSRLLWLQQGQLQVYILYVAIALVTLLVWKTR
ncbi:MAG TPA: proton-conducting transporter membrane subunit [Verrucomicrobiota bacterium]|nr:proton-conducting transporter membrane subunit [Verrucomicrobiota bacterium]